MDDDGRARIAINLRPIATPVPLTFLGLMIATVLVAGVELGIVPTREQHAAAWILLAVPFPLQLLAAAWAFPSRSAGAATASAVLAGTWLAVSLGMMHLPEGVSSPALGLLFCTAGAAMLVATLAEATSALVPAIVMLATAIRFFFSATSQLTGSGFWQHTAGYAGFVLGGLALYGALALELEGAVDREVLPVLRYRRGRTAVAAPLAAQLDGVEHEPGVRKVL